MNISIKNIKVYSQNMLKTIFLQNSFHYYYYYYFISSKNPYLVLQPSDIEQVNNYILI
jgi:hypothetical protein